ncbi:MAG: hypothetical protein LBS64_02010 [Spirochaetaceae bacterium]|nr:hypothetical protein [Spirochaetaceae bacterium]
MAGSIRADGPGDVGGGGYERNQIINGRRDRVPCADIAAQWVLGGNCIRLPFIWLQLAQGEMETINAFDVGNILCFKHIEYIRVFFLDDSEIAEILFLIFIARPKRGIEFVGECFLDHKNRYILQLKKVKWL